MQHVLGLRLQLELYSTINIKSKCLLLLLLLTFPLPDNLDGIFSGDNLLIDEEAVEEEMTATERRTVSINGAIYLFNIS